MIQIANSDAFLFWDAIVPMCIPFAVFATAALTCYLLRRQSGRSSIFRLLTSAGLVVWTGASVYWIAFFTLNMWIIASNAPQIKSLQSILYNAGGPIVVFAIFFWVIACFVCWVTGLRTK